MIQGTINFIYYILLKNSTEHLLFLDGCYAVHNNIICILFSGLAIALLVAFIQLSSTFSP